MNGWHASHGREYGVRLHEHTEFRPEKKRALHMSMTLL
jgi:hypothetical protein